MFRLFVILKTEICTTLFIVIDFWFVAHVVNQERIRMGGLFLCVLGQCISKTQGANRLATIHNMVLSMDNKSGKRNTHSTDSDNRSTETNSQPDSDPMVDQARPCPLYIPTRWLRPWMGIAVWSIMSNRKIKEIPQGRRYLKEPRYVTAPTFVVLSDRLNKSAKWKHAYFRTSCNNCGKPASDQYFMDYRASICRPSP